jgi:hypothetical protein
MDEDMLDLLASLRFSDPKHWVSYMCSNIPQADGIRVLVTCWAIWYARRKAIHGIFKSPFSIIIMINRLIEEFEIVQGIDFKEKDLYQEKSRIHNWIAPQNSLSQINTDAVVDRIGTKGVVTAVYCTDQGGFIAASAMVIPHITKSKTLEAMACSEALALAEDRGITTFLLLQIVLML